MNEFRKLWCGLDQISVIIFQIDYILSLIFIFYLNNINQTLPEISGTYYMLLIYSFLGIIFFLLEVKDIAKIVEI